MCFSVSFRKFLRTILRKICKRLLPRQVLGHKSFKKIVYKLTTDFINKNNENIQIIKSRSPNKI